MRVGTQSLLYGAHTWCIHPFIVWYCYIKLYGWTWDWRVILCFFIHDLGYRGCDSMDGEDVYLSNGGRWHPLWAYNLLLNWGMRQTALYCLYHSRFMTENFVKPEDRAVISRLGVADKLAVVYTPVYMYTNKELMEYIINEAKILNIDPLLLRVSAWKDIVNEKCLKFVEEWKDKAADIGDY